MTRARPSTAPQRRKLTAVEVRQAAANLARLWAAERRMTGDPEGADEMRELAKRISRIRLTVDR